MIYAMSDLHGCFSDYLEMLEKIDLKEEDTLYILGDVIDRGLYGIDILLDMMKRPNIKPLIGNHEDMALPVMRAIVAGHAIGDPDDHRLWMYNGGETTKIAFRTLSAETQRQIIDYIESFSLREELCVGEHRFHLSHSLPEYVPDIDINKAAYEDLIWGRPDYNRRYHREMLCVTGHTPTMLIDEVYAGRIFRENNHFAIDCGAVFYDGRLGCLCLDTLEEFYVD